MFSYGVTIHLLVLVVDVNSLEGCPLFFQNCEIDGWRELQRVIFSMGLGLPYGFLWEISLLPVPRIKCCCSMKTRKLDNDGNCRRAVVVDAIKGNVLVAPVVEPF